MTDSEKTKNELIEEALDLFWNKLYSQKYRLIYMTYYYQSCKNIDTIIRIVLAALGSAAIAAWAKWNNLAQVSSLIIVITQVLSTINLFLPYQKNMENLSKLLSQLDIRYLEMEKDYIECKKEKNDNDKILQKIYEYETQITSLENRIYGSGKIYLSKKNKERVQGEAKKYFKNNFGA